MLGFVNTRKDLFYFPYCDRFSDIKKLSRLIHFMARQFGLYLLDLNESCFRQLNTMINIFY